jgi:hypothetical protein
MLDVPHPLSSPADSLSSNPESIKKLADHDDAITAILCAIHEVMNPAAPKRRGIGFAA